MRKTNATSANYDQKYDAPPLGFPGAGRIVRQLKMAVVRLGVAHPSYAAALAAYDAFLRQIGWKRRNGLTTEPV
jgi:hypothetical protein